MSYHLYREEGPQTLKYKWCHGIAKEVSNPGSNKPVQFILQMCFVFFFFGFKCHVVGGLTEILAATAFLGVTYVNEYFQNLHYGMAW